MQRKTIKNFISLKIIPFILCLSFFQTLSAQSINLVLKVDSSVDVEDLDITYLDGIDYYNLTDSIINGELRAAKPLYAPYSTLQILQKGSDQSVALLLNEKLASITIRKDESGQGIACDYNETVINLNDTVNNQFLRNLNHVIKEEQKGFYDFVTLHASEFKKNDSINHLRSQYYKDIISKTAPVIREYADDYLSFYYYKGNIEYAQIILEDDSDFFRKELLFMKETFPSDFLNTEVGKAFIRSLENDIEPVVLGSKAPSIDVYDIKGNQIRSDDFKGKYVLLDFWATWCPPCMAQIPVLKRVKEEFPKEKLEMIGISVDKDVSAFLRVIRERKMDWTHLLEEKKMLTLLFDVKAFPTLILIDPSGDIVYRKVGGGLDIEVLREIINDVN